MAERSHSLINQRAPPGSDARGDAATSEPSVDVVIRRARIISLARITSATDKDFWSVAYRPELRTRGRFVLGAGAVAPSTCASSMNELAGGRS